MSVFRQARALVKDVTSIEEFTSKLAQTVELAKRQALAISSDPQERGAASNKVLFETVEKAAAYRLVLLAHQTAHTRVFDSTAVRAQLERFETLIFSGWQGYEKNPDWLERPYTTEDDRKLAQQVMQIVMQGTVSGNAFSAGAGTSAEGSSIYLSSEKYELLNGIAKQEIGHHI